ncbi:MAG: hypothetical protein JWM47_4214 [Acidimicrobiales bacterium]|nr:hypothetical protein [Acidimicrobiales bacterium]
MVNTLHWTPELVQRFWDGVARTELDNLSFGKVAGPKFLELIKPFLAPAGTHLDFGAGSGHVMQLMMAQGYPVAGFDPSPERQTKLTRDIGGHPQFLGIEGFDSTTQYDVVLLMEVIEHILPHDYDTTLARVAAFVKPGGLLVVSTPNNENLEQSQVFCPVSETLFHPWQHVRSFTSQSLALTLEAIGFRKDFLLLADFSNDAEMVDALKRYTATDTQRMALTAQIAKLSADFSKSLERHIDQLAALQSKLHTHSNAGLLRILKNRASTPRASTAYEQLVKQMATELSAMEQAQSALTHQLQELARPAPTDELPDHEGVNRRIGKETTIVYVGRKI